MNHIAFIAALGLFASTAPTTAAQTQSPLPQQPDSALRAIDNTLTLLPGTVTAISETNITLKSERETTTVPRSQILALVTQAWIDPAAPSPAADLTNWSVGLEGAIAGVLQTTSGERLPGYIVANKSSADLLVWESSVLGPLEFPLDQIDQLNFSAVSTAIAPDQTSDVLTLVNGDRIEGFITSITSAISIEGRADSIPLERIASIDLANPAVPQANTLVWCRDGSIFTTNKLQLNDKGEVTAIRGTTEARLRPSHLRSINFHPDKLLPLSSLPTPEWSSPDSRRWTPEPSTTDSSAGLGSLPLRLPGPGTATWTLPPNPTRFAAVLELPIDCRAWGNPTVTISINSGTERTILWTGTLDRATPTVAINEAIASDAQDQSLVIDIQPGARGGIQNQIAVRNALILAR